MHNTGIYSNVYPGGGFQKFFETGWARFTDAERGRIMAELATRQAQHPREGTPRR